MKAFFQEFISVFGNMSTICYTDINYNGAIMLDSNDIKIYENIFNYLLSVSIENNDKLTKGMFMHTSSIEDYFESLRHGFNLDGMKNYYSSFFEFVDLVKNNVDINNVDVYNDLFDHDQFIDLEQNSHTFVAILKNHIIYDMNSLAEFVIIGVNKWQGFAKDCGVNANEHIKQIELLENNYMKEVKREINPFINFVSGFRKYAAELKKMNDNLANEPNNPITHRKIKEQIQNLNEFLVINDNLINKYKSKNLNELISVKRFDTLTMDIFSQFEKIYDKGCQHKNLEFSFADTYVNNSLSTTSTAQFLSKKMLEDDLLMSTTFESGKYRNIKIFKDNSIVVVDNQNNNKRIFSNIEAVKYAQSIIEDDIKYSFRKNPVLCNKFVNIYQEYNREPVNLYLIMNTYLENDQILKSQKFNMIEALNYLTNKNTFEDISFSEKCERVDDEMNKLVKDHKLKQYAHSISSNKYMHLYDEKSYKIIQDIYDLDIESSVLQDNIGKKIAAYKTPADFNDALKNLLNSFNEFTPEQIKAKALKCKSHVVYEDDNKIILNIEDFKQSKIMGSSAWCIARDEHYFKSYVGDYNHQYFIYDFSKDSSDNESMIGITLTHEIECYAAHLKNDDALGEYDQVTLDNIEIILKNDGDWYKEALMKREKHMKLMKSVATNYF
jgi:hypothetical protein